MLFQETEKSCQQGLQLSVVVNPVLVSMVVFIFNNNSSTKYAVIGGCGNRKVKKKKGILNLEAQAGTSTVSLILIKIILKTRKHLSPQQPILSFVGSHKPLADPVQQRRKP